MENGQSSQAEATTTAGHAIRKARTDEADALARTLAQAFYEDPVVSWLLPDDSRRLVASERGFRTFLRRVWLAHEETYVAEDAAGVCVWEPPGMWKVGLGAQLALIPALVSVYGRGLPRLLSAITKLEKDHPRPPHWYLPFVGVQPERQGRGIGTAVMHPILERCDVGGTAAYLEASAPDNRALYERLGFEVTEELTLGRGAPPIWRMWRAGAATA
jgi:ribosomal protein S18 acetylase RimI-like enzyme